MAPIHFVSQESEQIENKLKSALHLGSYSHTSKNEASGTCSKMLWSVGVSFPSRWHVLCNVSNRGGFFLIDFVMLNTVQEGTTNAMDKSLWLT